MIGRLLTASAALLVIGATSRPARDLPPTYVCVRTSPGICIDGSIDDAGWDAAHWTEDFIDIRGVAAPAAPLRTRAKMLWDDRHLYIAAELEESNIAATIQRRDQQLFREQCFEVFLDPGGDAKNYLELQLNPLNTSCDLSMNKPYRDGGEANVAFDLEKLQSAVRVRGTINQDTDEDAGWTLEVAIPWAAIETLRGDDATTPPPVGTRWRMNLARMQPAVPKADGKASAPRAIWVWSSQGEVNMHLPERWGFVEFAPIRTPD